jgi:hypothetical protein
MGRASMLDQAHPTGIVLAGYAADRLLRLHATLLRQRAAAQLLHGPALDQARGLLSRAIFTLYLDCREAGVGEEASRLLAEFASARPAAATLSAAGDASVERMTDAPARTQASAGGAPSPCGSTRAGEEQGGAPQ